MSVRLLQGVRQKQNKIGEAEGFFFNEMGKPLVLPYYLISEFSFDVFLFYFIKQILN